MKATKEQIDLILKWYPDECQAQIAKKLGISRQQVHYHLSKAGAVLPGKKPRRDPATGKYMTVDSKAEAEFYQQSNLTMLKFQTISLRKPDAKL